MRHKTLLSRRDFVCCGAALIVGVTDAFGAPHTAGQALTVSKDRPVLAFLQQVPGDVLHGSRRERLRRGRKARAAGV